MRTATIERKTRETSIRATLSLDGKGEARVASGIPFFDHMLDAFARHGGFDLELACSGDLEVDGHHTIEDCGLVIGQALREALGDKAGITRYGHAYIPFDETLVRGVVDLSGRPYLVYRADLGTGLLGTYEVELTEDFFGALCTEGKFNLHLEVLYGRNRHHKVEGLFKACTRALRMAVALDPRTAGVPSTKGSL
ncbi:MAG: imidazoleglycerol-phosphate dehydratase HisB [Candidatus Sericytochromatia bacterium]|uniref:Imidazoleglycerol-phosphate dehydratase n=1 Tax=Candidatus Tanganyikabacteria bacterium TaxID=2961651 RepID=A0A938BMD2_9BACT|nr:imidazoleglycerol-phosphate dehydratase HisB [Candidatus Tanganyikabacteria bacterium]